jgi:uncharacterized peroxidase-related enzyme
MKEKTRMKPRIQPLARDRATPVAARILDQTEAAVGRVPNLHATLAHSPAALSAYTKMAAALAGGSLEPRLREQIAVATAAHNGCAYCASAHGAIGSSLGLDGGEIERNLRGESEDPRTQAVLGFVQALIERRGDVSDEQEKQARRHGLSDGDLLEVAAHVGLNAFTNLVNVFARTEIDWPELELPEPRACAVRPAAASRG